MRHPKLLELNVSKGTHRVVPPIILPPATKAEPTPNVVYPSIIPRDVTITPSNEFLQKLANSYMNILKTINLDLIDNILDTSGKIIVNSSDLVELIALITGQDASTISVQAVDSTSGCCLSSYDPFKTVGSIMIGNVSFSASSTTFEAYYNYLSQDCCLNLSKVYVTESFWETYFPNLA